eukprot:1016198-Rhodomonas_salina.2
MLLVPSPSCKPHEKPRFPIAQRCGLPKPLPPDVVWLPAYRQPGQRREAAKSRAEKHFITLTCTQATFANHGESLPIEHLCRAKQQIWTPTRVMRSGVL